MPDDPRAHQKLQGFLSMNAVTHIGELIADDLKHPGQPFFVKCSCGSEGRFPREDMARWWMGEHLDRRGGQWKQVETEEAPSGSESPASESQQDDARVQTRDAEVGVETRTEGNEPQAGDSDSAEPRPEAVVEEKQEGTSA